MSPKKEVPETSANKLKTLTDASLSKLSAFLDDSDDVKAQELATQEIVERLNLAASQNSFVVMQVQKEDKVQQFITLSGWIATKTVSGETLMLRLQDDTEQLQIVKIDRIRKVSTLSPNGDRESAAR